MHKLAREILMHIGIISSGAAIGYILALAGEPRNVWFYCNVLGWC
ncbi:hypothetical protein ACTOV4_07175 [Brucella sp. C7-11G]